MQNLQNINMIKNKVSSVLQRMAAALQKSKWKQQTELVAVSKTKTIQQILEVYNCGIRHFGQNYVQQIQEKHDKLPNDIKWHFIGHLQSNKLKKVLVPNLCVIQTIDRQSLAQKLNTQLKNQNRKLDIMIQIKTSEQQSKYGLQPSKCKDLIIFIKKNCLQLNFTGLMTIGKQGDLEAFRSLNNLKKQICQDFNIKQQQLKLSMGMSADFQQAILQGSTSIRVGSLIFGPRNYKK